MLLINEHESIGLREEGLKPQRWVIKEQLDKKKKLRPSAQNLSLTWANLRANQRKCADAGNLSLVPVWPGSAEQQHNLVAPAPLRLSWAWTSNFVFSLIFVMH